MIVEENLKLAKENQSLRKEKGTNPSNVIHCKFLFLEQLDKWRRAVMRKYKIDEDI